MKHLLDEKLIEAQLNKLQPFPSPRFYRRMARAAWTPAAITRRRAYAVTGLALALAAALLVFTPQGRAWAQEVLHFFVRTESDHLPLQSWQLTRLPTPTTPAQLSSLWNAEEQAGFVSRKFIAAPAGLTLQGARVEGKVIFLEYASPDAACRLTLAESFNGDFPEAAVWSRFSQNEIDAVKAGGITWERVHENSTTPPVVRLRWEQPEDWPPLHDSDPWQAGTLRFEMVQACNQGSAGYLDDYALLTLAPKTVHSLYGDPLVSVEQAEQQVGFQALQLSDEDAWHFILAGARVDPQYQRLTLVYNAPDEGLLQSGVTIDKWPATIPMNPSDLIDAVGPSAEVKTVALRGTTGEYVVGVWHLSDNGPIWESYPNVSKVRWQEDGYWFELAMFTSDGSQTMEELIAIADGMK